MSRVSKDEDLRPRFENPRAALAYERKQNLAGGSSKKEKSFLQRLFGGELFSGPLEEEKDIDENGTTIVIMGDEVAFGVHGSDEEVVCPDEFVIVHDVSGKILRACDFYVLRNRGVIRGDSGVSEVAYQTARRWYGDRLSLEKYRVDLPDSGWQRVGKIDAIRYRRLGVLGEAYQHPYDPPIVLYRSLGERGWKCALPDGCIVDERGFVYP
jgi:hypothetical protein